MDRSSREQSSGIHGKGLTARRVIQGWRGGGYLVEVIERQRLFSQLKRGHLEMGRRNDMGTAAEAVFLRTRGDRLPCIRSHAELSFKRGGLPNLRAVFRLRSYRRNRRPVIVALAKTGNAEIR